MTDHYFWRLLFVGLVAFVLFCLLSVALAPELANLILLAYVGGQVLRRLDQLSKRLD